MTDELHFHFHIGKDGTVSPGVPMVQPSAVLATSGPEVNLGMVWERIGEIRGKQINHLDADEITRERRQAWVAGMLQAIQILRTGEITDVTEDTWDECQERFPFPDQKTELGELADYRDVSPQFINERNELVPEEARTKTATRSISPVEALADPTLRHLVTVEDATGEEADAVVSEAMFDHATEQLSDS